MKLSIYSLLIMGIFALTTCSDDNGIALSSEDIVGTWNLTAYDSDTDITRNLGGINETTKTTSIVTESTVTVTFNSDGTWISDGDFTISITVDDMTETSEETGGIGEGTYSVVGGKLTMNGIDSGDESKVSEIELNTNYTPDTKIEMDGNAMESGTDPFLGLEFSIDLDLSMVLEK